MIEICITATLMAELAVCIAGWYRLQDTELDVADALCRAVALTLVSLGFAVQLLFLLHLAHAPWLIDLGAALLAACAAKRGRRRFFPELLAAARPLRRRPEAWALAAGLALSGFLVMAVPPDNWDSMTYNLARVLVMTQENTLAPLHYNTFRQLSFSPGFDLLHYFFLRYGADQGMAVFSWLSWLGVMTGSYVLARGRGDAAFALRVALVVGSLKLLALQSSSTKNDIGATVMAVACVVGAAGFLARRRLADLLFPAVCACYGLSTKSYFLLFAAPFFGLLLLVRRREIAASGLAAINAAPWRFAAAALLLLAALQLGLASQWINLARFGNPFGPAKDVALHKNADGAIGAVANLARYAMQMADAPGLWWFEVRREAHVRLFGPDKGPGASMVFHERYAPGNQLQEDSAWFGLLGGLLVAPCVVAGLFRRDLLTRLTAAGLCCFLLAVCANITWFSYNNRFLSLFFGASAPCLAAARGLWHDRVWPRRLTLALAVLTLAASLLLNQDRSLIDGHALPAADPPLSVSIFDTPGGRRASYDFHFGGPLFLDYVSRGLYPGRKALLIAGKDSWVYPVLFFGRRHHWLTMGQEAPTTDIDGTRYDIRDCAQLRQLAARFDLVVVMEDGHADACLDSGRPVMTCPAIWGDVRVFSPGSNVKGE